MAEATFQPASAPGSAVESAVRGIEQGDSMMMRASQLRQAKQMEEMRAQQMEQDKILFPVKLAAAKADLVTAGASVALATRQQEFRQKAGALANQANDEFLDAMQLADWDSQSSALAQIQAKYSWMGMLPEYKPFLDTVDKQRANAVTRAITDQTLEARLDMAAIAAETGMQKVETQQAGATTRTAMTTGASLDRTKMQTGARKEVAGAGRDAALQRTQYKSLMQQAAQNDSLAAKMSAAGSEENAAVYRRHAQDFRDAAEAAIAEPEPTAFSVPNVTNKAPSETPATEVSVPGEPPADRLYIAPQQPGEIPSFAPTVKTPEGVLKAFQQMVDDGVIDADQARESLKKLGFKRREG